MKPTRWMVCSFNAISATSGSMGHVLGSRTKLSPQKIISARNVDLNTTNWWSGLTGGWWLSFFLRFTSRSFPIWLELHWMTKKLITCTTE